MDLTDLHFERQISASPSRVFHALTDPASRQIWGAPDAGSVVTLSTDAQPTEGSRDHGSVGPAENPYVDVVTDWVLIDPAVHVSYVETLKAEGAVLGMTLAHFGFSETDTGTTLTVHLQISNFIGDEMGTEMIDGWHHAIEALTAFAIK